MLTRLSGKSTGNPAFLYPRVASTPSRDLAHRLRNSGYLIPEPVRLAAVLGDRGDQPNRFFSLLADSHGEVCQAENNLPVSQRELYRLQQRAYVVKIRNGLTPRPVSEALKEFDSTKDNPPNSQSARFGVKPETDVYEYRLVSWGEAGSGIPLVNNPYSVRPHNAPPVDPGFQRKKFTVEQRDTVRSARYRQAVQNILNTGLHNSHGLASRFLGPETSANIAPSTFTNNKNKNWGQGEMQSHLEHALFRIEGKASRQGVSVFLRCTDYLGKFGELQSRKIKVFLSEAVTDPQLRAEKGNVKETTLGTFYFPGMVNEPETSELITAFKGEVSRLERAVELVLQSGRAQKPESRQLESHQSQSRQLESRQLESRQLESNKPESHKPGTLLQMGSMRNTRSKSRSGTQRDSRSATLAEFTAEAKSKFRTESSSDARSSSQTEFPPLEVRYKHGVCAQDLKELACEKLVYGKQFRTNDGLKPVLQRSSKPPKPVAVKTDLNRQQEKQQKVFHQIQQMKENPHILKAGEELWVMDDIETALGHIRRPDLQDHIKSQVESGELDWEPYSASGSGGLSYSSSENSLSSLSTVHSETTPDGKAEFEIEFADYLKTPGSTVSMTASASASGSASASASDSGSASASGDGNSDDKTPVWLKKSSEKKRKPQLH